MAAIYNLARMYSATTGSSTVTLTTAVPGYLTFDLSGVSTAAAGVSVDYGIKNGLNSEVGTGTYTSSSLTLTRTPTKSTNGGAAISLVGQSEVYITVRAETLNDASLFTGGTLNSSVLANVITAGGPVGSATSVPVITWDAKGRLTAVSSATLTVPAEATQAEMEAASGTTQFASPSKMRYSPYSAKAWVKWGTTTTIDASAGVSSITDNAVGDWTITFSSSFSSANYVISSNVEGLTSPPAGIALASQLKTGGQAAGSATILCVDYLAGSVADPTKNHFIAFGDLP